MVPAIVTEVESPADTPHRAAYFFFILVNATLYLRPAEIVADWAEAPVYYYVILPCLLFAYTPVLRKLRPEALRQDPVTLCLVLLLGAVVLSHLAHFFVWGARTSGFDYLKVLLYYLLLIAVIDSAERLRSFLRWLVLFNAVAAVLALLQYHGVIDIAALTALAQKQFDPNTGEIYIVPRLRGTGFFNDPNDLCLSLDVAFLMALFFCFDPEAPNWLAWAALLALFGYAIVLTQSRGGVLALTAGLAVLCRLRYGWGGTLVLLGAAVPVLLLFLAQRQTVLTLSEDTAQDRLQLWSQGLDLFRQQPVFGIGAGQFEEQVGQVAHNSFVHAFTELGIVGGVLFLGAFVAAGGALYRLNRDPEPLADPFLERFKPYLFGIVAAYAVGIMTLSRGYTQTTYLVLGLAVAFVGMAGDASPRIAFRFDGPFVRRVGLVSAVFLVGIYVYVRLFVRWS
jgi:O-antigen ligase